MVNNVTVIVPSHNTLEHLKNTYRSIRQYYPTIPLIIIDDASTDGTDEWLTQLQDDYTTVIIDKERKGHTFWYDEGMRRSTTDIVAILHSDMMIGPYYFDNLLKHLKPKTVVCATRVEPPIHPEGREKIVRNFGLNHDDYQSAEFEKFCLQTQEQHKDETTKGIFAPWILYKSDHLDIGGHDQNFAPYGYEDSDMFNRWILAGYQMIQSRDALVYHLTCRGHRWNKGIGIENNDYKETMAHGQKYFIRKWGQWIQNDEYMYPIIYPKYDIRLIITNLHDIIRVLSRLEPFFSVVQSDNRELMSAYFQSEQIIAKYDISPRMCISDQIDLTTHDVNVILDNNTIDDSDYQTLYMLNQILSETDEIGDYEIGNIRIHINKLEPITHTLIHA